MEDANGEPFYMHRLRDGDELRPRNNNPVPIGLVVSKTANDITSALIYSELLHGLTLSQAHKNDLNDRGLSDFEVVRRQYRTLPPPGPPWVRENIAADLADRFGAETLAGVPGFVRKDKKNGSGCFWTFSCAPGLLIPVRDKQGRIVAMMVKPDHPSGKGAKYLWVSSKKYGGVGPGIRAHLPLPWPDTPDARGGVVVVVEGILKADIVTALQRDHFVTIGIPGHSGWKQAMPILRELGPRIVRYAPDPDAFSRRVIGGSLRAFQQAVKASGYRFELLLDGGPRNGND